MPKYVFECEGCQHEFKRTLKMGDHKDHPCPLCHNPAPRVWSGQGFSHNFAPASTAAPANTGVAKNDYPTGDQIVGASAEARWAEYKAREEVKQKVREVGGNRALIRRQGVEGDTPYVEYEAGTENLIQQRKKLVEGASKAYQDQGGVKGQ